MIHIKKNRTPKYNTPSLYLHKIKLQTQKWFIVYKYSVVKQEK